MIQFSPGHSIPSGNIAQSLPSYTTCHHAGLHGKGRKNVELTVIEGMVVYLERLEANDGFYYLCQVFQPLKIKLLLW